MVAGICDGGGRLGRMAGKLLIVAAGDTLTGRRLPVVDGRPGIPERPGDYSGPVVGFTGDLPMVQFLKPNACDEDAPPDARSIQHITSPPHTFAEEADGSLTVSASISAYKHHGNGPSDGWHGYLEHGVWREV